MVEIITDQFGQVLSELVVTLGLLMPLQSLGQGEEFLANGVDVVGVVRQQHFLLGALLDDLERRLLTISPQ